MKEEKEFKESPKKQLTEPKHNLRALLCGDFISSIPVEYLEYLGYDMKDLRCDVCDGRLKPNIFIHYGIPCIKHSYVFENREAFILFICCKRTKTKNCKHAGVIALAQEGFLEEVDEIYEQLKEEEEEEDDEYDEENEEDEYDEEDEEDDEDE